MGTRIKTFVFGPFMENTSVVYDDTKECVIIDPGCFDEYENEELKSFIENEGLTPVMLLQTHTHLDHVFGVPFVSKTWGLIPQVHPLDKRVYDSFEMSCMTFGIKPKSTLPEPHYVLKAGEDIIFGNTTLKVHHIPGHCPGHVVFECEEENFIVSGDVLFERSIGRTDLPGGDHQTLIDSIKNILFKLDLNRVVYSGHGRTTTLGEEKLNNPFLV
ncbi:MAG: MBL fold hydrolase [Crocinitomicaceae bacterium]|nr:MBL fold hydrolase [Crocinitomicaceae bacterium]|tara:strand:+ start:3266 stop:3910 length:645 start_codon:yes stop_codon:yes gene_type:complete